MKMIQVRNVPDPIHRKLKLRAVGLGMSLSDFLLAELKHIAERPTLDEMLAELRQQPRRQFDSKSLVRAERDSR